MSPEWEIFFRKSMELSYGVPEGVNGTRKKMLPVAWTACSYLRRLRFELSLGLQLVIKWRERGSPPWRFLQSCNVRRALLCSRTFFTTL